MFYQFDFMIMSMEWRWLWLELNQTNYIYYKLLFKLQFGTMDIQHYYYIHMVYLQQIPSFVPNTCNLLIFLDLALLSNLLIN